MPVFNLRRSRRRETGGIPPGTQVTIVKRQPQEEMKVR
jgi:hypothetical protein